MCLDTFFGIEWLQGHPIARERWDDPRHEYASDAAGIDDYHIGTRKGTLVGVHCERVRRRSKERGQSSPIGGLIRRMFAGSGS